MPRVYYGDKWDRIIDMRTEQMLKEQNARAASPAPDAVDGYTGPAATEPKSETPQKKSAAKRAWEWIKNCFKGSETKTASNDPAGESRYNKMNSSGSNYYK